MPQDRDLTWEPSERYVDGTRLAATRELLGVDSYRDFYALSIDDPDRFWAATLTNLGYRWIEPYDALVDLSHGAPNPRWFVGAKTNVVDNALSRWAESDRADDTALIDVPESGEIRRISYRELASEVAVASAALTKLGIRPGDRVALVLPFNARSATILLGLAAAGAVAVPLFAGYGVTALADRLRAAAAQCVIVADRIARRGVARSTLEMVVNALSDWQGRPPRVVVVGGLGSPGRPSDVLWDEVVAATPRSELAPIPVDPNADLLIAFSSGTTGEPKGIRHSHAGLPLKVAQEMAQIMDIGPGSTILRITDLGWIGGPYTVYSGLITGATVALFGGSPTWPTANRVWSLVDDVAATHLAISPTLARQLRREDSAPEPSQIASLRMTTSVGEAWDRGTYEWYWTTVGNRALPIVNHSGGTEVGNLLCAIPVLPISFGRFNSAVPGIAAAVYGDEGEDIVDSAGELVVTRPFVGMTTGLLAGDDAYLSSYWRRFYGSWHQNDRAVRHADGTWELLGRSDDRLKVSGRGVMPSEIEAVALAVPGVLGAAVIGTPDEITGTRIVLFLVPDSTGAQAGLADRVHRRIRANLGSALAPQEIYLIEALPRTPNGKVARRLLHDERSARIAVGVHPLGAGEHEGLSFDTCHRAQEGAMDDESINQEQIDRVREEFIRRRGWWGDEWEAVLRIDPEFIEKYGEWSHVPVKHRYLDPKVREFVWIAVDASVTHLYQPGLRRHIRNALRLGASKEEVMEVIELVSIIGIHSAAVAGPMIAEEAEILAQQAASGNEPELDRNDDQERH